MSISHNDEHGARTSHHTHCCIGACCATHYATGDVGTLYLPVYIRLVVCCLELTSVGVWHVCANGLDNLGNMASDKEMLPNIQRDCFPYLIRHWYSLSIDECKDFVVVHHRVHAFNPQCVNRAIKHNPFFFWLLICQHRNVLLQWISGYKEVKPNSLIAFFFWLFICRQSNLLLQWTSGYKRRSLMAEWLEQVSQWHKMHYDLEGRTWGA